MRRQEAFRKQYDLLRRSIDERLRRFGRRKAPAEIRDATSYVIEGGGKRVRGVIVMLSCQVLGEPPRQAIDAAAAVEILHNFTLVHDDIMDSALERRGRPSVHQKWGVNTALLLGDVLVGEAYASLLRASGKRAAMILGTFTGALQEVCDGQALDMELERRTDVSVREYFPMIDKKTGALLSAAAVLGGMVGGGTRLELGALGRFGRMLGRAFQLQDDLLDVVADPRSFGKAIGGDIIEGKKTFLLLT
ncbi:MAG TPA: polyprenyl synthetase family protein, partial [Bacteroidota bacterium]|nr:polyprenyl synthetase family protein [Bacteroidota bacterium]